MEKPNPTPIPARRALPIELALLGVTVIVVVAVALWSNHQPKTSTNTNATLQPPGFTETPSAYSDVFVTVKSMNGNELTTEATLVNADRQQYQKSYLVTVNDKTTYSDQSATPKKLTDIAVGQTLQVFGDTNIAPLETFTATKIVLR